MASIPFTTGSAAIASDLASKLFNTINRRHELKSQGKLAELQANLERESRLYATNVQRIRDKDYQNFQKDMQESTQSFNKKERIATQQFRSVQADLDRKHAEQMQQAAARYSMLQTLYATKLNEYVTDRERLRQEGKDKAFEAALADTYNAMAEYTGNEIKDKTFFKKNLEKISLTDPKSWLRLAPGWMGIMYAKDIAKGNPIAAGQQQVSGTPYIYESAAKYGVNPMELMQAFKEQYGQGLVEQNPAFRNWVTPRSAEHKIGQLYENQWNPIGYINRQLQNLTGTGTGRINTPYQMPVNPNIALTMQEPGMGGYPAFNMGGSSGSGRQVMPFTRGMSLMDIMREWETQIGGQ